MKIGIKKLSLFGVVAIALIIGLSIVMFMQQVENAKFVVYAAGTPDAYGDRINELDFFQNATGTWENKAQVTYNVYTPGYSLSVPANQHTIIRIIVRLNYTFAPDLTTAASRARIYINISGVVTNGQFIYETGSYDGIGWALHYNYPSLKTSPTTTWIPQTDTTYTITTQYQAYY